MEGGSPQRSSGGEGRRRRVDDCNGSDRKSAAAKVLTWSNYGPERFFLKWWQGRRCSDGGDPHGTRRRRGELARLASMAGDSSSNSVLEEEATTASLFPGLDGDGSGSVVAGHGKQSQRGGERSRAVAGRREGEGNGRQVPLLAMRERVRTTPRGAVVTDGVW
jgi:hypothetical protein